MQSVVSVIQLVDKIPWKVSLEVSLKTVAILYKMTPQEIQMKLFLFYN